MRVQHKQQMEKERSRSSDKDRDSRKREREEDKDKRYIRFQLLELNLHRDSKKASGVSKLVNLLCSNTINMMEDSSRKT
jgi:hypothetical protein